MPSRETVAMPAASLPVILRSVLTFLGALRRVSPKQSMNRRCFSSWLNPYIDYSPTLT